MLEDKILPANVTSIPYETAQALFYSGQAAMFFGGDWNVGTFEDQDGFNYSAFRLPEMMDLKGICIYQHILKESGPGYPS